MTSQSICAGDRVFDFLCQRISVSLHEKTKRQKVVCASANQPSSGEGQLSGDKVGMIERKIKYPGFIFQARCRDGEARAAFVKIIAVVNNYNFHRFDLKSVALFNYPPNAKHDIVEDREQTFQNAVKRLKSSKVGQTSMITIWEKRWKF